MGSLIEMPSLCLVVAFFAVHFAAADDLTCTKTTPSGTIFTPYATNCEDKALPETCQYLFGSSPVVAGALVATRPQACYMNNGVNSAEFKAAAIINCPRHCGFCCATDDYNCYDLQNPRSNCSQVLQDTSVCKNPIRGPILTVDCPASCGFCRPCYDDSNLCAATSFICTDDSYKSVRENCRKTCGLCFEPVTAQQQCITEWNNFEQCMRQRQEKYFENALVQVICTAPPVECEIPTISWE